MSDRLSRKEIKQDDQFISTVESTLDYGRSHGQAILIGVGAAVALILIVILGTLWFNHRARQSSQSLAAALSAYNGPVVEAGQTAEPQAADPTFASDEERRARARELFEQVSGGDAEALAQVYLARIAAEEGDLEKAESLWQEFLDDQGEHLLAMEVRLNLLSLRRARGQAEAVAQELEAMLGQEERPLPEDVILFELASTLESLGRPGEALSHYQRIVDEFPKSLYGVPARQKTISLADTAPAAVPVEAATPAGADSAEGGTSEGETSEVDTPEGDTPEGDS